MKMRLETGLVGKPVCYSSTQVGKPASWRLDISDHADTAAQGQG